MPVYRYIYVRCGYFREIAEEITQDVFLQAWEKRSLFDHEKSSLKNWIYVIARNKTIDYLRKSKKVSRSYLKENEIPCPDNEIEKVEMQELTSSVLEGLELLRNEEKELLVLRYVQDMKISEIATLIGKNSNSTKVALHRALKKLKRLINED